MQEDSNLERREMWSLIKKLFPICRSITGAGVRQTLNILNAILPLQQHEVASGTPVFDWTVPKEWNIRDAFLADERGRRVIDFQEHNLHVLSYSVPVDKWLTLEELQPHLYSLPDQPDAIPYITSYYREHWGFCLSDNQRSRLQPGKYRAVIDSELKNGHLTYGEWILPGASRQEIFFSTYICHPSMANNELSGPVVAAFLGRWLASAPRRYTYRIIFIPETIGSLTYLSRNLAVLRENVVAGINISCVGDERAFSYLPSRCGDTLADRVLLNTLSAMAPQFMRYSFLDRGSDERQYCAPGIDLPVASFMRSKYSTYPEYHTSLDDLNLVTANGLWQSLEVLKACITTFECNKTYQIRCLGEPQLGKRGLYPNTGTRETGKLVRAMMNFICYADGTNDLVSISDRIGVPVVQLLPIVEKLVAANLI